MASGAAGDGFFGFLEGSMAKSDRGFQRRRPYHKNCGCALHDKSRTGQCSHSPCNNAVSYPLRRAWSEGSLALMADSAGASPGSSPAMGVTMMPVAEEGKAQLFPSKEE